MNNPVFSQGAAPASWFYEIMFAELRRKYGVINQGGYRLYTRYHYHDSCTGGIGERVVNAHLHSFQAMTKGKERVRIVTLFSHFLTFLYRCTVHSDIHTVHSPTDAHLLTI
jgi:hypothetical protein